jgi:hypothetical protein
MRRILLSVLAFSILGFNLYYIYLQNDSCAIKIDFPTNKTEFTTDNFEPTFDTESGCAPHSENDETLQCFIDCPALQDCNHFLLHFPAVHTENGTSY